MSNAPTNVNEYGVIAKVVQHYIDGAKSFICTPEGVASEAAHIKR